MERDPCFFSYWDEKKNQGYISKGKGKEYNGEKVEFLTDLYLLFLISFLNAVDFTVKP